MKKLTRVKLINWHRFVNTTIEFDDSTLLTGENGAGKSTLLDAIQYVVICSAASFNKAAHDNGKRKLTGYVRCKTGRENQVYERTGEISAHVALEFYEEKKKQYFVVGAVIDSASEGQEKSARYLMDKATLDDIEFIRDNTPQSITRFRASHSNLIKTWCTTDKDARVMVKNRFGRIEDKFFHLIPKALAFRPIDDIKDFVYSYVLDKKEVNIDILRENVRTYQELQKTLESVRTRLGKLERIEGFYQQVMKGMESDRMYDYYLEHADADIVYGEIRELERRLKSCAHQLEEAEKEILAVEEEKQERRQIRDDLHTELAADRDFIARNEQQKKLDYLQARKAELEPEHRTLLSSAAASARSIRMLSEREGVPAAVSRYLSMLKQIAGMKSIPEFKDVLDEVLEYKKTEYDRAHTELAQVEADRHNLAGQLQEIEGLIAQLQRKKLSYPQDVNRVLEAIRDEFSKVGREAEPRILCELLEITDDAWRNAVEGYMNTQRFYILVEPDHFDIALGTYDRLRKEKKAFGVGLINTRKLEEYETAPKGSLAEVVTSANPHARRYINMILGKVTRCDHYNQLKQHKTAITRGCMKYQNHVASAIKPAIYETPYIGKSAIKVQLQQAEERRRERKKELRTAMEHLADIRRLMELLSTEMDTDIKYRIDVLSELRRIEQDAAKCRANIETLEKNTNMLQKQMQLAALENMLRELDAKNNRLNSSKGSLQEKIRTLAAQREEKGESHTHITASYTAQLAEAGEKGMLWEKDYHKQMSGKTPEQFRENFARRKKANLTTTGDAEKAMIQVMAEYKTAHDFGAAPNLEGYGAFAAEYRKLHDSELLQYEEKVGAAREAAEEEFREQFLSKLQENMKVAQSEFKDLNKALKDIAFSNEKYEFLYMPSRRHRQYYEMIMDDFNVVQGESIFSGTFHETHREVIDELFERLALDNENQARTLEEFTDYRTYMDYDIKILHSDDSYSYYSKVCEEKSGGETQTPFYVTVAASFVQLYRNSIGGEAIGLVMFDEAFNNMDDERIGGVLEFLGRLPLQIIIAAPPDKIQYISPHVTATQLLMTDEKVSFAERYHNGAL